MVERRHLILLVMRHGEAGPESAATSDEERKLTEAGMARNRRVLALAFDLALAS